MVAKKTGTAMPKMTKAQKEEAAAKKADVLNEQNILAHREAVEAYKDIELNGDGKAILSEAMDRLTSSFQNIQAVMVVRSGRHQVRLEPVEPRKITAEQVLYDRCSEEPPKYPDPVELTGYAKGLMTGLREAAELRSKLDRMKEDLHDYRHGHYPRGMVMCGFPPFGRF